ncbi:MAG: hypothetical protein ACOX6I_10305 [Syntrophomonadaceae bacterium]
MKKGGRRIHKLNERGSISIAAIILCMCLFVIMALTADIARLYAVKVQARHSLNLALRAACSQLDMDALADPDNPRTVIIEPDAEEKFYKVLRENLRLDNNNNPGSASVADKQVEVCDFRVINTSSLPFTYTYNGYTETINKVSCSAIIKVPVKLSSFARFVSGMPEYAELMLHSTVGPEERE